MIMNPTEWFGSVVQDKDDLIQVAKTTKTVLFDNLSISATEDVIMYLYYHTFNSILEILKSKQKDYDEYVINIADRLKIGYTNITDESAEKQGNFQFKMQHMNLEAHDEPLNEDEKKTLTLCVQWNASNIKEQTELLKDISIRTYETLKAEGFMLESYELVIPIFAMTHKNLVKYAELKFIDSGEDEYSINVLSLYDILITRDEDNNIIVSYPAQFDTKHAIKSDVDSEDLDED